MLMNIVFINTISYHNVDNYMCDLSYKYINTLKQWTCKSLYLFWFIKVSVCIYYQTYVLEMLAHMKF